MPRGRYDNKRAAASGNTTTLAKKAKASPVRGKKVQKGRKTTSKAESSPSLSSSDALMQSFEGLGTRISRADAVSFCSTAVNYASAGGGDDDLFFVKHAKKGEAVMAKLFEALYLGNDGDLSFSSVSFLNMLASRITTDWIYSLVSQLTGVCLLGSIGERLRELEFAKDPSLKRRFEKVKSGAPHSVYLVKLIPLALVTEDSKELAKILELFTTLLMSLPTRRYVRVLLSAHNFLVRIRAKYAEGDGDGYGVGKGKDKGDDLIVKLVGMLDSAMNFPIDDSTGEPLSSEAVDAEQHARVGLLQRIGHKTVPKLAEYAMNGTSNAMKPEFMMEHLGRLDTDELEALCHKLRVIDDAGESEDRSLLLKVLVNFFSCKSTELERLTSLPLYPCEEVLWNENLVPNGKELNASTLALPKLGLQFLSFNDYLTRCFTLYRLDSTYDLRSNLVDAVKRLSPTLSYDHNDEEFTSFRGWAKMALPLGRESFHIVRAGKPRLGEVVPSAVEAELVLDLKSFNDNIKREWNELREFDNLFLLTIDMSSAVDEDIEEDVAGTSRLNDEDDLTFGKRFGIRAVRGVEVVSMVDEAGKAMNEMGNGSDGIGSRRTLRVTLDAAQYHKDIKSGDEGVYSSFNVVVRRSGKENNFHAVLETMVELMKGGVDRSLPAWLNDVLLGFGNPKSANYSSQVMRNFALNCAGVSAESPKFSNSFIDGNNMPAEFTPTQQEAILSGLSPGLTMIVGPPGTGKTDTATAIIGNLYKNNPTQRTLIITHSNAALNDIFEKLLLREDIDERHILRLGRGESNLSVSSTHDFTKSGRVDWCLARRLELLNKVSEISESMGVSSFAQRGPNGESSYTCETAGYFYKQHNLALAKHRELFEEIEEFRPFELLRGASQRGDLLLTKQARIIAMTATHASLVRAKLVKVGFSYDNLVVEEAAQMLDVETFVPLVMQKANVGESPRLKRVCLIGDHNQLPPVVKNLAINRFSNFSQSLFTRLIQLGATAVHLDVQGRSRPEIAELYNWRYENLGNLERKNSDEMLLANAGFAHVQQFINVEDYRGVGESSPSPHYYQNVGEAEMIVSTFLFMCLIGYDPNRISILATYNGQADLIRDVLNHRAGARRPRTVSTVDQFQGQQNDYILLSLTRSKSIGFMRDVRRMIVALSRARLGCYIFGRRQLFKDEIELAKCFEKMVGFQVGEGLDIVSGEFFGKVTRKASDKGGSSNVAIVKDIDTMNQLVASMGA